ncbi:MAG: hypothetical protein RIS64_183 [Bacteroidota bacterium]
MLSFLGLMMGVLTHFSNLTAQTCGTPASITASVRDTFATLVWTNVTGAQRYLIEWRVKNSGTAWRADSTTILPYRLDRLTTCTTYEVRVSTRCANGLSTPQVTTLRTTGCQSPCSMQNTLSVTNIGTNEATLNWSNTGATTYEVDYWRANSGYVESSMRVNTNRLTLVTLSTCTDYFFRVRSICTNNDLTMYSDWSTIKGFSTTCTTVCPPPSLQGLTRYTENLLEITWYMVAGKTYECQYKNVTDSVWITSPTTVSSPYTFNNLLPCASYNIRFRSICNGVRGSWGSAYTFSTVCPRCAAPYNLRLTASDTTILAVWDTISNPNPMNYLMKYRLVGDTAWQSVSIGRTNNYVLSGLLPCSAYEVSVTVQCVDRVGGTSGRINTRGCQLICPPPTHLTGTLNDSTSVTLNWQGTATGRYLIEYRDLQDSTGQSIRNWVTGNSYTVRLSPCRRYSFKVQAGCSVETTYLYSSWSDAFVFQTLGCSVSGNTCAPPVNLAVRADTIAFLSWDGTAARYAVAIKDSANTVIRRDTVYQNWFIVQGLSRNQRYGASVSSICNTQSSTDASVTFTTLSTNRCNIVINPLPTQLQECAGTPSILTASTNGTGNTYQWQSSVNGLVWTDSPNEIRATIQLSNLLVGTTFVRVRVGNPNCPTQSFFSNITRLMVTACAVPCTELTSVTPTMDSTGITFNLAPAILAGTTDSFEIQYRRVTDSVWTSRMTVTSTYRLTGLTPCVAYESRIRRVCSNGVTTWKTGNFTISNASCQNCNFFSMSIFADSNNVFRMTTVPQLTATDTSLRVLWRTVGDSTWRTASIIAGNSSHNLQINGQPCVNYQFQVRRLCDGGVWSSYLYSTVTAPGTNCGGSNCNIIISSLPNEVNACQNVAQTLVANVQGSNYTIQWQMSSDSITWRSLSGATTNTFNVATNNLGMMFMRYVVNSPNCTSARISNTSKVIIRDCICEPTTNVQLTVVNDLLRVNISPAANTIARDSFNFWYKRQQDSLWLPYFIGNSSNFPLSVQACATYEVKAQRRCLYSVSAPVTSTPVTYFTPQCCAEITSFTARDSSAGTLITVAPLGSGTLSRDTFEVQYRKIGETVWNTRTFTTMTTLLPRLDSCTDYTIQARRKCTAMGTTGNVVWTNWKSISYRQCSACLEISSIGLTTTASAWSNQFSLNIQPAIASNSRDSFVITYQRIQDSVPIRVVTALSSFTRSLQRCETYVIQVHRRCGQFNFSTMRIDTVRTTPQLSTFSIRDTLNGLNLYLQAQNGASQDSFQVQYRKTAETNWASSSVASNSNGGAQAYLRLPRLDQCTPYLIRARLKCGGGFSEWKEMNFYACDTVPCNASSLRVTVGHDSLTRGFVTITPVVTFDTITIRVIDPINGQNLYNWDTHVMNVQNTFTIPNLVACKPYYVEVARLCTRQGISDYSVIQRALTIRNANCTGGNCTEIATMTARDSSIGTVVSVTPNLNMPSDSFEVRYRKETVFNWNAPRSYASSPIVLPRLDSCVNYKIQVRRKCNTTGYSTWKEITFRRAISCLQDGGASIRNPEIGATGDFTLYPIPTNEVLNLNYELSEAGSIRFDILNLQGQLVQTIDIGSQEKGSYQHRVSDLSALPSGFYLMTMRVNRKVVAMRKWQKF